MNIKLKTSTIIALSEMIDVMDIKDELLALDGNSNEEVGKKIIMLFVTRLHKVKKQFYDFVIKYKEIKADSYEEQLKIAESMDAVELVKEIIGIEGISDFLASK